MPRTPTVTVEGTVEAIEESNTPVVSTGQLADHFDVTRQAIRDHRERLRNDPRIETGQIGNNTVFYLADIPLEKMEDRREEIRDIPAGGMTEDEVARRSGEALEEILQEDKDAGQKEDTTGDTTQTRAERFAHPRVLTSGALMLFIGMAFLPAGTNLIVSTAVVPGAVIIGLAFISLLLGTGLVGLAAGAQWYLARPLKELLPGVDVETSEVIQNG